MNREGIVTGILMADRTIGQPLKYSFEKESGNLNKTFGNDMTAKNLQIQYVCLIYICLSQWET